MKRTMSILLLLSSVSPLAQAEVYAQLINKQTQDKSTVIAIQPIKDSISGIDWDEKEQALTIKEDGVYTIISTLQYNVPTSTQTQSSSGNITYWINANSKPLPDTGHSLPMNSQSGMNVVEYHSVLPLKAGTKLHFMLSSTTAELGLKNMPGTQSRPSAPGLSVSLFKVGNIVDFL